jgi:hypothetical protein
MVWNPLEHFTTQNSPLPSDKITAVTGQPVSGEVFVATEAGMVSYRGTATAAENSNGQVKVFPNPVRPDFQGLISISGLAANASVKITDVSGKLVFQTQANGGTAVWNGLDYQGRKPKSGIYLVFSALPDGQQGFVSKIVMVN